MTKQELWKLTRFWGGVIMYIMTLVAGLINSYNSEEFTTLNIIVPVLLLVIAVSIAMLGYTKVKEE